MKRLLVILLLLFTGAAQAMDACKICPSHVGNAAVAMKEVCAEGICKVLPSKVEGGKELIQICTDQVCRWLPLEEAITYINDNPGLFARYVKQPAKFVVKQAVQYPQFSIPGLILGGIVAYKYFPVLNFQAQYQHKKEKEATEKQGKEHAEAAATALEDQHRVNMDGLAKVGEAADDQSAAVKAAAAALAAHTRTQEDAQQHMGQAAQQGYSQFASTAGNLVGSNRQTMLDAASGFMSRSRALYGRQFGALRGQVFDTQTLVRRIMADTERDLGVVLNRHHQETQAAFAEQDRALRILES